MTPPIHYTLAQLRDGTGFPPGARFVMVAPAAPRTPEEASQLFSLLVTAMYGSAITYWCEIKDYHWRKDGADDIEGTRATIEVHEGPCPCAKTEPHTHELTPDVLAEGLRRLRDGRIQSTHTPGPWRATGTDSDLSGKKYGLANIMGPGRHIALMVGPSYNPTGGPSMGTEQDANARLIAAAPDLLEAAKGVDVLYAEMFGRDPAAYTKGEAYARIQAAVNDARAAIAKAQGGA